MQKLDQISQEKFEDTTSGIQKPYTEEEQTTHRPKQKAVIPNVMVFVGIVLFNQ